MQGGIVLNHTWSELTRSVHGLRAKPTCGPKNCVRYGNDRGTHKHDNISSRTIPASPSAEGCKLLLPPELSACPIRTTTFYFVHTLNKNVPKPGYRPRGGCTRPDPISAYSQMVKASVHSTPSTYFEAIECVNDSCGA